MNQPERRSWIEELESRLDERYERLVVPLMQVRKSTGARRTAVDISEEEVFQTSEQPDVGWSTKSVWDDGFNSYMSTTIVLKGHEVPDWIYGFISHHNTTYLPENGTADECKDGILAVMEESAATVVRRVGQCLAGYEINILTVEVDLMGEHITMHCLTDKPVMQVNTIMSNQAVRKAMPLRARVCVNTHVEQSRRTDEYLKIRPDRQEISREFFYEDGMIVRAEPDHWSAGSSYEPGDILRIGSLAMRVEENTNNPWVNIGFDGDPIPRRNDSRRVQAGTPFCPGERAYWNSGRNR